MCAGRGLTKRQELGRLGADLFLRSHRVSSHLCCGGSGWVGLKPVLGEKGRDCFQGLLWTL